MKGKFALGSGRGGKEGGGGGGRLELANWWKSAGLKAAEEYCGAPLLGLGIWLFASNLDWFTVGG